MVVLLLLLTLCLTISPLFGINKGLSDTFTDRTRLGFSYQEVGEVSDLENLSVVCTQPGQMDSSVSFMGAADNYSLSDCGCIRFFAKVRSITYYLAHSLKVLT